MVGTMGMYRNLSAFAGDIAVTLFGSGLCFQSRTEIAKGSIGGYGKLLAMLKIKPLAERISIEKVAETW